MNDNPKVKAAKRLVDALESDLDFALYLDAHPNEKRAKERLMKDLGMIEPLPTVSVEGQSDEGEMLHE